jgi:hypothetical protein
MIKYVHICKKLGTETAEHWYSHLPKPVTEHEDVTVFFLESRDTNR